MSISDFSDMMVDSITHEEFASRDAYGTKTYGSAATYTARVTFNNKLVRAKDGSQIVSNCQVWILGTPTINTEDRITLSDGTTPQILTFEQFQDDVGTHHSKLYMGA